LVYSIAPFCNGTMFAMCVFAVTHTFTFCSVFKVQMTQHRRDEPNAIEYGCGRDAAAFSSD
jgi:hypothetical protein